MRQYRKADDGGAGGAVQVTLASLASDCMERANGNPRKARSLLVSMLLNDRALLTQVADNILKLAADQSVRQKLRRKRASIVRNAASKETVKAMARGVQMSMFNFPLSNGLMLGDAKKQDVIAQADIYQQRATDEFAKAKWLRAIGKRLSGQQRVREVFLERELKSLYRRFI